MQSVSPTNIAVRDGIIHVRKVETLVAFHCNLSCRGCVHGSPALREKLLDPASLSRDLAALSSAMYIHKLVLLGGEPLLHPRLAELARIARSSGAVGQVAVITNGIGLEGVSDELFDAIDLIEVSAYPRVRLRISEEELRLRAQAHNVIVGWNNVRQFQETTLNERISNPAVVEEIFLRCKPRDAWSCHAIHDGRYFKCSRAGLLEPRLNACGRAVSNREADGVLIQGNTSLFDTLLDYLQSPKPLEACHWCLGSDGATFPHELQNARRVQEEAVRIVPLSMTHFNPAMRQHLAERGIFDAVATQSPAL